MKISLNLNDRQFPRQSAHPNHNTIQLIPGDSRELVIENFDNKKVCHLIVHLYGKINEWCTQTGITKDIIIPLKDDCRYKYLVELMPDGIKDEVINFDLDFR
jgi:hypothetical protein